MKKITDNEIQFFNDNGYLILKGVIQPDELAVTQIESQRLIDEILAGGPADEWCNRGPEKIPYYLTYLHSHPNEFSLRLLAHPFIGDLLHRIIGPDFIPCYESLVFKLPKHGSSVRWHRDGNAIRENHPIFNVDIYLDDSTVDNGCVWVIPKSHLWGIEEAQEVIDRGEVNFEREDAVPAEVEPGDILLHHTKVLHGSKINTSDTLRRVIYFDQRTPRWNERYKWWQNGVPDCNAAKCINAPFMNAERTPIHQTQSSSLTRCHPTCRRGIRTTILICESSTVRMRIKDNTKFP